MAEGLLNSFSGYLVEDHPPAGRTFYFGCFNQVPGDGLPLAVGVGGQVDRGGSGGGLL